MAVVVEGVAVRDLAVNATDGEGHTRQPPCGVVRLLAIDRDVGPGLAAIAVTVSVRADELHRLYEHARGAAAGVVHSAAVGLEHLDQELDHAARRVELAALRSPRLRRRRGHSLTCPRSPRLCRRRAPSLTGARSPRLCRRRAPSLTGALPLGAGELR